MATRKPKFKYNRDENNSNYLTLEVINDAGVSFTATLDREDNSGHIKNADGVVIADIPAGNIADVNQAVQNYMTDNLSCSFWGNQTPSTTTTVVINPQYEAQRYVEDAWSVHTGGSPGDESFLDWTDVSTLTAGMDTATGTGCGLAPVENSIGCFAVVGQSISYTAESIYNASFIGLNELAPAPYSEIIDYCSINAAPCA